MTILAHGIGGRGDLPVPFTFALLGAAVALVISFAILASAWRKPRFEPSPSSSSPSSSSPSLPSGRALPRLTALVAAPWFRFALQVVGFVVFLYVLTAAVVGPDLAINPTFRVVYVLFWVGLVPLSLLFGPIWRFLNPLRTLHSWLTRVLRIPTREGLFTLPAWLGYWPAAFGLFAFVWMELVAPGKATLPLVRLWFALYFVVHFFCALLFGSRWFDRGDAFEVYSALFGRLSPLRRLANGALGFDNPLRNLAALRPAPGLVAVVSVLLGSTAFDGFSAASEWAGFIQDNNLDATSIATLALLGFIALVYVSFSLAAALAGGLAGLRTISVSGLTGLFAHSVIPIALGYVVAHYLGLFVIEGQHAFVQLSDPLSNGANLLGLSGQGVAIGFAGNAIVMSVVKVGAVVAGHILGIVAAHDRAVALFPRRTALLGQIPLLVVMIGYTLGGLTLLFAA